MAEHKMPKRSAEFKCWGAAFKYFEENGRPEDSEKYWESFDRRLTQDLALNPKFAECEDLARNLAMAIHNTVEGRYYSVKYFGDDKHGVEAMNEHRRRMKQEYEQKVKGV